MSGAYRRPAGRARNWSWNRLDERFAAELVEAADIRPGELVLDLGAGDGTITARLVERGARVIAFELHPQRAAHLRRRFEGCGVTVVSADVRDLRLPRRRFRVVANPPFAGVSAVLGRLTHHASRLDRADLLVPRSVADAWSRRWERPGSRFGVAGRRPIPRSAFTPRPRIDVVRIVVEPRPPRR